MSDQEIPFRIETHKTPARDPEQCHLVAWGVVHRTIATVFTDPRIAGPEAKPREASDSLADALLIPRRLKREQRAAGIETVRRAGREAWRIHHDQEAAS